MTTGRARGAHVRDGTFGPRTDSAGHVGARLEGEVGDDAHANLDIGCGAAVEGPRHGGPEIVELEPHTPPCGELARTDELPRDRLGERGIVLGVTPTPGIGVATLVETLARVLTN